ncbi:MAG: PIN domain-containing protein [Candidatus Dormibacteraeota bacterium]|nr:PIN domain-containing protein [Candidatus Dormibacteraeota bacterium]
MIVLDTDVLSDLMRTRPSPVLLSRLARVAAADQGTTAITIGELAYGAHRVNRPDLYERAVQLLADTRILPFDRGAAEVYGEVRNALEERGTRLADPDLRIAATVLANRATLITGNRRHFHRVPHLPVEDWLHG